MLPLLEPVGFDRPAAVKIMLTLRGGESQPYGSGNLGLHVGDDAAAVSARRQQLGRALGLGHCQFLNQVHSARVVSVAGPMAPPAADGLYTRERQLALAVLTADCVPVVIWSCDGRQLAVVHAGWRGLCDGILPAAVAQFSGSPTALAAYIGPSISPANYEVDASPCAALRAHLGGAAAACLHATRPGHWQLDLRGAARASLAKVGVTQVAGGEFCTFEMADCFYSYRREGVTGRQATLAWLN